MHINDIRKCSLEYAKGNVKTGSAWRSPKRKNGKPPKSFVDWFAQSLSCGKAVSMPYEVKRIITAEGDKCRHCETPVIRQSHLSPPKAKPNGGGYYYEWWFKCPGCCSLYMVDDAKRYFPGFVPASKPWRPDRDHGPSQTNAYLYQDADDDGIPPW